MNIKRFTLMAGLIVLFVSTLGCGIFGPVLSKLPTSTLYPTNTLYPKNTSLSTSTPAGPSSTIPMTVATKDPIPVLESNGFTRNTMLDVACQTPCQGYSYGASTTPSALVYSNGMFTINLAFSKGLMGSPLQEQITVTKTILSSLYPADLVNNVMAPVSAYKEGEGTPVPTTTPQTSENYEESRGTTGNYHWVVITATYNSSGIKMDGIYIIIAPLDVDIPEYMTQISL